MTITRIFLVLVALAGTVVPFLLVQTLLVRLYRPNVIGTAPPLGITLAAYGVAALVAIAVLALCYRFLALDREPTDADDGLDEREDLPY